MIITITDRRTQSVIGYHYVCHGCGLRSSLSKRGRLPKRWVEETELRYDERGLHVARSGFVINCYCFGCHSNGVNARTVAATTRKFYRASRERQ